LRPCFFTPLVFAFRFPPSGFRFQPFSVSAFCFVLVAGLFDPVFHPQPVEQRALGLLLAGRDFNQVPNEIGSSSKSALFQL
jgi:hypothetical protein